MTPTTRRQKFVMLVMMSAAGHHHLRTRKLAGDVGVKKLPNKHRDRDGALQKVSELSDSSFYARFRMSRSRFAALLFEIRHDLERNVQKAKNSSKSPVYPYLQLCIGLRYLAGGSYLDISDAYAVHESTVRPVVWRVIRAINKNIRNVSFPYKDLEKLREHAKTFFAVSEELLGTVAAGDGVAFNIQCPEASEVGNDVRSQFSRKGFYTYSVLMFCDALQRIMIANCITCGSTNDGLQYGSSWLHDTIAKGQLHPQFHVVLDEAFRCTNQELSAHSRVKKPEVLSDAKDAFNYYLSLHRQVIERCFALFVWRWGIFWRPIRNRFGSVHEIVECCCRLHNWCQEEAEVANITKAFRSNQAFDAAILTQIQPHDPEDFNWRRVNENEQPSVIIHHPNDPLVWIPGENRRGERDSRETKRAMFTRDMEQRELKRPKHSAEARKKRMQVNANE